MLRLVEPSIVYKAAMLDAAPEMHAVGEWDITPQELEARFETSLAEHLAAKDRGTAPEGVLLYEDFWLLEDAVWIGLCMLRPQINEQFLHRGGHIGYVIRPSRCQQGYGTTLLRLGLEQARARGSNASRPQLTCGGPRLLRMSTAAMPSPAYGWRCCYRGSGSSAATSASASFAFAIRKRRALTTRRLLSVKRDAGPMVRREDVNRWVYDGSFEQFCVQGLAACAALFTTHGAKPSTRSRGPSAQSAARGRQFHGGRRPLCTSRECVSKSD